MKLKALGLTALAVAAAALVAACGGGGGDGAAAAQSDVQLSGVAATGLALASAPVEVKCASGTGTATTDAAGTYTVTVANGALPCIVKVTGTAADGTTVTLHSLAQGTGSTAVANVTPLTEMILARAVGTLPADLFANFGTGTAVTAEAVAHASTDILTALGTAANVDLSGIDPFKTSLVAATTANPTGGNDYDKLLDQLGTVVSAATLPQVVSQIASTTGSGAPTTLNEVVANVSKGTLAGCPQALSGKYRVIDYLGFAATVDFDFTAGAETAKPEGGAAINLVLNPSQNCEFKINDTVNSVETTVVIGPAGAGATVDDARIGYIFPAQSHNMAAIQGDWEFMESGIVESNLGEHFVGKFSIAANGAATVCDYNVMSNDFSTCEVDTSESAAFQEHAGGYFVLNYGTQASPVYAFRAPSGDLTLFGANNPEDLSAPGSFRTSVVMTRPQKSPRPAQGSTSRFWDFTQRYFAASQPATSNGALSTEASANSITNTTVTDTSVTRTRSSDGRVDTWQLDQPIPGLRFRAAAGTLDASYQRFIPGTGMAMYIDGMGGKHFAGVSVNRP